MYNKNAWEKYSSNDYKDVMDFNEDYKVFLSNGKTERAVIKETIELAQAAGFRPFEEFDTVKTGDKFYVINHNKNIALFVMGSKPLSAGMRVLGAHIDSPRMDLKPNPLYEAEGFALLDTHYYGGIKKYQWVAIPLSLHGVVIKRDGSTIDVVIGEDETDPVLGITDLLPHLAQEQMDKKAAKLIDGEKLDLTFGSIPVKDCEKDATKENIVKLLKDKYDIEEEDFLSAEIEVVPAGPARDYGIDRSMVAGYGHDDRVCAYTSLQAILAVGDVEYTSCCILVDKEEVGSIGATGAQSLFFENTVGEILEKQGNTNFMDVRRAMQNTMMLSSDVSAALDPLYPEVTEKKNAAFLGNGIVFNKYTGARGKSGSNDASPEYMARIRKIMDEEKINFQTAELGKVDQGGGGTIAYILGNYNMNVIDAGVAVLNMHAPMEVVSKVDVYEAYLAYKVFLEKA